MPGFAVILLAAGASSRMGRPKLLLPWGDTTVIGHLVQTWRHLGSRQTAVVIRPDDEPLIEELDRLGVREGNRIKNPDAARGMFSSIRCAAQWTGWQPDIASFVISLGDQPQVPTPVLHALLEFHWQHPGRLCQPSYRGRRRHPVVLPRAEWARLGTTSAATLKDFLDALPVLECPINDARLALDLDTPEDYKRLIVLNNTRDT